MDIEKRPKGSAVAMHPWQNLKSMPSLHFESAQTQAHQAKLPSLHMAMHSLSGFSIPFFPFVK